jgi:hypothetical protein
VSQSTKETRSLKTPDECSTSVETKFQEPRNLRKKSWLEGFIYTSVLADLELGRHQFEIFGSDLWSQQRQAMLSQHVLKVGRDDAVDTSG